MSEQQKMSNGVNKLIPIIIVVAVVIGGGAFFGGMKYAENKNPQSEGVSTSEPVRFRSGPGGGPVTVPGGEGGGMRAGGIGLIAGEIIAKDDNSVTIKIQDGGSKIIFLSDSTAITKSESGTLADLEVGGTIGVSGDPNSDGSITARSIQLRPQP